MDLEQGLNDAWSGVASFVPKLVGAIIVLIIGWIIAKVLANLVRRVLPRVGFDRVVERSGLGMQGSSFEPSSLLAKLVYWAVLLFTLQLAFGVFGDNPVSDILRGIIGYLPNVFVAVLIMVVAGALATIARDLVRDLVGERAYGRQLGSAAWAAILVFGAFIAIAQLQIAPAIVNALWWAVLTAAVGAAVIAFGVGGIPVARRYLERAGGSQGRGAAGGVTGGAPDRANVGAYHEEPTAAEPHDTEREETRTEHEGTRAGHEPRHATPREHDEVRPEDVTGPRDGVTRDTRR